MLLTALSIVRSQSVQTLQAYSLQTFACRACHDLSYTSAQKHDARLYRLLKVPEDDIVRLVVQDENMTWKLLAIRAGYIRLGFIRKY